MSPSLSRSDRTASLVELVGQVREGSSEALEQLLLRVQAPVYRYLVSRLRAAPDAEDLALDLRQEALIRVTSSLARCDFASDERVLAWVFKIARNVMLDHLRAIRGRDEVRDESQVLRAAAADGWLQEEPASLPLERFAAEALKALPDGTAELLRLRLMTGRTWKEIGEAMQIAQSAAKRRFQRAQAALRRHVLAQIDAMPTHASRAAALQIINRAGENGAAFRSPDSPPGGKTARGG